ncbi:uncharacterized protein METZ01_LOCUS313033 [marine metagenome]|uniref:Uncharacterized protein n=1 Tax=marine metagenome TaxID=408172 RepID=A0A382NG62_9ZZZZ
MAIQGAGKIVVVSVSINVDLKVFKPIEKSVILTGSVLMNRLYPDKHI